MMKKRLIVLLCAAAAVWLLAAPVLAAGDAGPEAAQIRFEALTGQEKEEIFRLGDQIAEMLGKLYKKYEQLGVLDTETAGMLSAMSAGAAERCRAYGRAPGLLPPPPLQGAAVPRER